MLCRFIEKILHLFEQLGEALIELLDVKSDEARSQIVRWMLVAFTTMVVAVIVAVVLLSGMHELDAKLKLIERYVGVMTPILVAIGSVAWTCVKVWRKLVSINKKKSMKNKPFSPRGHVLATGDEEMDSEVLWRETSDFVEKLGEDVGISGKKQWTLFDRNGLVFASLRDPDEKQSLQINVILIMTKAEQKN